MRFKLRAKFQPSGDQPKAIKTLEASLRAGHQHQTLLGVTGSGKTFTMANVIAARQTPTLVICHNKTLAAQLTQEYRTFFPENAVEYFVSYYDYYQPEAYLPSTDTYIEKEATINEEIDRLRHAATQSVLTRRDTIIVASVSAIYNIGSPLAYEAISLKVELGQLLNRETIIKELVQLQFERNDTALSRGSFRARGGIVEVMPTHQDIIYRLVIDQDTLNQISLIDPLTYQVSRQKNQLTIYPARHYVTDRSHFNQALLAIESEARDRVAWYKKHHRSVEAERLSRRVRYDLELIRQIGYCNGIENYSRYFDGRRTGEKPHTLVEYFPKDFLLIIDESHATIPQLNGMYEGDRSRKQTLIDYGFRLPSALDNRPLKFQEFLSLTNQIVYTSATPGPFEISHSSVIAEQIVRPTGLVDPEITIQPQNRQIEDLLTRIHTRLARKERVLVTTLTKQMAEDLAKFLKDRQYNVHYLHSDVETIDRIETLTKLRQGAYDILVGVNLLREGLDLPEVSLVAILDADKEGFLRSQTSLIQIMGRAARNVDGEVVLYADHLTSSMKQAIAEAERRRTIQLDYNRRHGITPQTIQKEIKDITEELRKIEAVKKVKAMVKLESLNQADQSTMIKQKEQEMKNAAQALEFELAAILRDEIVELKKMMKRRSIKRPRSTKA